MKTLKKNNKGFSLVELIVVILIMAIIAVALAPQVMKWVDESKISADNSNKATIKSAVDAAVADYMSTEKKSIDESGVTVKIKKGTLKVGSDTSFEEDGKDLGDYIARTLNYQYPGVEQDGTNGFFLVTISGTGAVTVKINGDFSGSDISGEDF